MSVSSAFCLFFQLSFDSLLVQKRTAKSIKILVHHFKRREIAQLNKRIKVFLPKALIVWHFNVYPGLFLLAAALDLCSDYVELAL